MAKIHRRTIQKDLHDPDNQNGVITHLEPDILECEVKWALGSITTNKDGGSDGIPVELFQILKDDAVKVLHSMSANLENSAVATELEKVSFHSNPEKGNAKKFTKSLSINHLALARLRCVNRSSTSTPCYCMILNVQLSVTMI